jgi:hypothetical protein
MKSKNVFATMLIITAFVSAACTISSALAKSQPAAVPPQAIPDEVSSTSAANPLGQVVFTLDKKLFRISAQRDSQPEDISAALDKLSPGADEWINISADGQWLLISSERFDPECQVWACLAVVPADLSRFEVLKSGGSALHTAFSAIGPTTLVYVTGEGPHKQDLWVMKRQPGGWSDPSLLTTASNFSYNLTPSLSVDEQKVLLTCYGGVYVPIAPSICEVSIDGSDFNVQVDGNLHASSNSQVNLRHPAYAPDGSLIFASDWQGEQVWRLDAGGELTLINGGLNNDTTPCVLPGGLVASLWLDRPGGNSQHELKIMSPDGQDYWVLMQNEDISDIGIGCGK